MDKKLKNDSNNEENGSLTTMSSKKK